VSEAARTLAEAVLASGARRVAFLGLAKNVGKTTALVAVLEELHRLGRPTGVTSAGRDGERFDAITGEPKPRFRILPGQWVASAASTFASASFPAALVEALPFPTRFGAIEVRRSEGDGEIEVIGPSTASQLRETAAALERAGATTVLLDGAIGRRAFAGARVSDAIVLSVGLAAGGSIEAALAAARAAVELIRLGPPAPGAPVRDVEGALTDALLAAEPPRPGEALVAEDFASIFLEPAVRGRLRERGASLAVRRPARLLALTSNPTAPARPQVAPAKFFEALGAAVPGAPLFDLVADLQSTGA